MIREENHYVDFGQGMTLSKDEPHSGNLQEQKNLADSEALETIPDLEAAEIEEERLARLNTEILERLGQLPLNERALILKALADDIEAYRDENNGWVPRPLFGEILRIGGKDVCAEVVVRQVDEEGNPIGYLLKKRGAGEQGWDGQYQVVGCSLTDKEGDDESIKARLAKEVFGVADPTRLTHARRLGQTLHSEAKDGRSRACRTEVCVIDVEGADELEGGNEAWQCFTMNQLDERVVAHHRNTLAWADDEERPKTVDLRERYVQTRYYKVMLNVYAGAQNQGTERCLKVRASDEEAAAQKARRYANLPEYTRQGDQEDFWSYKVQSVKEAFVDRYQPRGVGPETM